MKSTTTSAASRTSPSSTPSDGSARPLSSSPSAASTARRRSPPSGPRRRRLQLDRLGHAASAYEERSRYLPVPLPRDRQHRTGGVLPLLTRSRLRRNRTRPDRFHGRRGRRDRGHHRSGRQRHRGRLRRSRRSGATHVAGFALARYLDDGTPDPDFSVDGEALVDFGFVNQAAAAVAIDSQGRIVVTGTITTFDGSTSSIGVARLLPDGTPDPDFGTDGEVVVHPGILSAAYDVAIDVDDWVVVMRRDRRQGIPADGPELHGGRRTRSVLRRRRDRRIRQGGRDSYTSIAIDPRGRLLLGGSPAGMASSAGFPRCGGCRAPVRWSAATARTASLAPSGASRRVPISLSMGTQSRSSWRPAAAGLGATTTSPSAG